MMKTFKNIFSLSLSFLLSVSQHELGCWQNFLFIFSPPTAVTRKRKTIKREAIFRTKPPFHAVNTHRRTRYLASPLHPLSPPTFPPPLFQLFSLLHLVLLPPSTIHPSLPLEAVIRQQLCSPAQTQPAAVSIVVKHWSIFLVAMQHEV